MTVIAFYTAVQATVVTARHRLGERGEVNTAAILAWVVVAVLVIMGGKTAWDSLIADGVTKVRSETGL